MKKIIVLFTVFILLAGSCMAGTQGKWSIGFNNIMLGNVIITNVGDATSNPALLSCIPTIGYGITDNSVIDAGYIGMSFLTAYSATYYLRYTYYLDKVRYSPHIAVDTAFSTVCRTDATRDFSNFGLIVGTELAIYQNLTMLLDFRLFASDTMISSRGDSSDDYRNASIINLVPFLSLKWTL